VGLELYLLVFYAKFLPNMVPVSIYCTCGQIQKFRNFFCGLTTLNKICYLYFCGSKLKTYFLWKIREITVNIRPTLFFKKTLKKFGTHLN